MSASHEDIIGETRSLLANNATLQTIAEHLEAEHKIPAAKVPALVDEARAAILTAASTDLHWHLACSLQRTRDLYQSALHIQDYAACLKIEKEVMRIANQLGMLRRPGGGHG